MSRARKWIMLLAVALPGLLSMNSREEMARAGLASGVQAGQWPLVAAQKGEDQGGKTAGAFTQVTKTLELAPAACLPRLAGSATGGLVQVDDRLTVQVRDPAGAVHALVQDFRNARHTALIALRPLDLRTLFGRGLPGAYTITLTLEDLQPPTYGNGPLWLLGCAPATVDRDHQSGLSAALLLLAAIPIVLLAGWLWRRSPGEAPLAEPTDQPPVTVRWQLQATDLYSGEACQIEAVPDRAWQLCLEPLALVPVDGPAPGPIVAIVQQTDGILQIVDSSGEPLPEDSLIEGRVALSCSPELVPA